MSEQSENLERVSSRIAKQVVAFCQERAGREFHMEELASYVAERAHVAPDSAGRILRSLRARGVVKYSVVSRYQSLYRVEQ